MKLPGKRKKRRRGIAIAMTLFFVLVAFFAASTLLVRSHFEAQATVMDTVAIQREALARSALASGQAMLETAGTNEDFAPFSLAGPGGMEAKVWLEQDSANIFRLYAQVDGGLGRPYLAQKVLRKKPRLTAIDLAHLNDGDLATADQLKYRVVGSEDWVSLPSSRSSLMWVKVDRRGNVTSNYFPVLETGASPDLPDGFIARLVEKNEELTNEGRIEHGFFKKASLAIEENWDLNINKPLDLGVGNAAFQSNTAGFQANSNLQQNASPQLENNPDLIRPARVVADALTKGAAIEHYSQDEGTWTTLNLDLSDVSGGFPGPAASDGKGLYFPILKPGADSLSHYDFESETWSELTPPPALNGKGETHHLLNVQVDDDGRIYAHHGDDNEYGISVYDPQTKNWKRLPSPKGIYVDKFGKSTTVTDQPGDWGNLEVDDQGNVYVVWRTKNETAVLNHLATNSPFVGGLGGSGIGINPGTGQPGKPNAGVVGAGGNPAYGGTLGGGSTGFKGTAKGLLSSQMAITPPKPNSKPTTTSTSPYGGGNAGGGVSSSGSLGLFPSSVLIGMETPSDMILKLSDGEWTAIRPPLQPDQTLGGITTGIDGRLVIHALSRDADAFIGIKPDGTPEPPSKVPDQNGSPALYFAVDSGAQKDLGKFSFQETADY